MKRIGEEREGKAKVGEGKEREWKYMCTYSTVLIALYYWLNLI